MLAVGLLVLTASDVASASFNQPYFKICGPDEWLCSFTPRLVLNLLVAALMLPLVSAIAAGTCAAFGARAKSAGGPRVAKAVVAASLVWAVLASVMSASGYDLQTTPLFVISQGTAGVLAAVVCGYLFRR